MTVTEAAPPAEAEVQPANPLDTFAGPERAKIEKLVRDGLAEVEKGKRKFPDLLAAVVGDRIPVTRPVPVAPPVPAITEEHRKALAEIASLYGIVAPTEPRLLTNDELAALAKERTAIDTIVDILGKRKSEGIREAVANHADKLLENDGKARREPKTDPETGEVIEEASNTDANGHYTVKQVIPIPGTDQKFERRVVETKPKVNGAVIQAAYDAHKITRAEYLAVTVVPEIKRDLSEEKLRKAIKKDPGLLFRLAEFAEAGSMTTSIYLT